MSTRIDPSHGDEPLRLICRDIESGLSGELIVRDDNLLLKLFSFDAEPRLPKAKNRYLQLETGEFASLLNCQNGGPSERWWSGGFKAFRQDIRPHFVFLGARQWTEADKVGSIYFTIASAIQAINYCEHHTPRIERDADEASSGMRMIVH